jgi:uncharacterized protein YkvS
MTDTNVKQAVTSCLPALETDFLSWNTISAAVVGQMIEFKKRVRGVNHGDVCVT